MPSAVGTLSRIGRLNQVNPHIPFTYGSEQTCMSVLHRAMQHRLVLWPSVTVYQQEQHQWISAVSVYQASLANTEAPNRHWAS
jgi:hypothetical protein